MTTPVAIISGKKVREDDLTRWFIYCYDCGKAVSEAVLDDSVLANALLEHNKIHETTKEN